LSHQSTNERGRDTLEVDAPLTDGDVTAQVRLMHAPKWSQKGAHLGPQTFERVGMHLTHPIPIIVPSPLLEGVAHCGVLPAYAQPSSHWRIQSAVPSPLVRVHNSLLSSVTTYVGAACPPTSVVLYSQPHLSTLPAYRTHDGRSVPLESAMSPSLVGSTPGRIPLRVSLAFSPPHPETSRLSQNAYQQGVVWVGVLRRWLVALCVWSGLSSVPTPTLWLGWLLALLSALLSPTTPPDKELGVGVRTLCRCRWCRPSDTFGTGTPAPHYAWCGGTLEHVPQARGTPYLGSTTLARGNAPLSTGCILLEKATSLLGIPYLYFTYLSSFFNPLHSFCT
jgi:hypothetical protein